NWTQKSPQNSPLARVYQAMAYDSAHTQAVLFGGATLSSGTLTDTWTWDGSNLSQKSPQNSPSARANHGMASDPAHSQVVPFAGGSNFAFGDTWTWDSGVSGM